MGKASDTSNQAANGPTQNGDSGGGADPGLGTAGPRSDAERAAGEVPAGQRRIRLSGDWQDHKGLDWITVDDQTARDLDTAGYVIRGRDGTPLTVAQHEAHEQARRAHAEGAQDGSGAPSDGDATAGTAAGDTSK